MGESDGNGTNGLSLFVNGDGTTADVVTLTVDAPATAIGGDFSAASSSEGARFTLADAGGISIVTVDLNDSVDSFFGIVTSDGTQILALELFGEGDGDAGSGEGLFLDNVVGVSIPEPVSAALLLTGVGLLATRRRG